MTTSRPTKNPTHKGKMSLGEFLMFFFSLWIVLIFLIAVLARVLG